MADEAIRSQSKRYSVSYTFEVITVLISTKGRYVTRMLLDIAMHQGDGYVSMKEIAARQQISKKYIEALTAPLVASGILAVRRGKTGGYRLLASPDAVTLWDVVALTEGPMHAVACLERPENTCARCGFCIALPAWEGLDRVVREYLRSVTLGQLLRQAKPQPDNLEDYPCGV